MRHVLICNPIVSMAPLFPCPAPVRSQVRPQSDPKSVPRPLPWPLSAVLSPEGAASTGLLSLFRAFKPLGRAYKGIFFISCNRALPGLRASGLFQSSGPSNPTRPPGSPLRPLSFGKRGAPFGRRIRMSRYSGEKKISATNATAWPKLGFFRFFGPGPVMD